MREKRKQIKPVKHGLSKTRLYKIWAGMKNRCYNTKDRAYFYYGERGIIVDETWRTDFLSFYNWSLENGYSDELTIDRIDVYGNYEPSNCRWVTVEEQSRNKSSNIKIKIGDKEKVLAEWCREFNLEYKKVHRRLRAGYTNEEALELTNKELSLGVQIEYKGVSKNITAWAEEFNIPYGTFSSRLKYGWSFEEAAEIVLREDGCNKVIEYNGIKKYAKDWAKDFNLNSKIFISRYNDGWSMDELSGKTIKHGWAKINGETKRISEWCKYYNKDYKKVFARIYKLKWSIEEALELEAKEDKNYFKINGEVKHLKEWAKIYKISYSTVMTRMSRGKNYLEALEII